MINSIDIVGIKGTLPSFAGHSPVFIGEMEDKEIQVVTESSARSVLKGFTWRLVATFSTIVISYLITGETDIALKIGAIEFFAKIGRFSKEKVSVSRFSQISEIDFFGKARRSCSGRPCSDSSSSKESPGFISWRRSW